MSLKALKICNIKHNLDCLYAWSCNWQQSISHKNTHLELQATKSPIFHLTCTYLSYRGRGSLQGLGKVSS
jgi:hypothetical protein